LIFKDRFCVYLQGTLIPHGLLREGHPVESALQQRTKKSHGRSATSWVWAQELQHWAELSHDQIEKAASDSAQIAKAKAALLKECRATQLDPQVINKHELYAARAKREGYYWSKLEKASRRRKELEK
ncbi:hypothetical protein BGZ70_006792, partial [Mortierella alpina]